MSGHNENLVVLSHQRCHVASARRSERDLRLNNAEAIRNGGRVQERGKEVGWQPKLLIRGSRHFSIGLRMCLMIWKIGFILTSKYENELTACTK